MENKIIEAAVWAFAQDGQYEKALNAAFNLKLKSGIVEGLDELLKKLSKYYLRQIDLLNRGELSVGTWAMILRYFQAAYEVAKKINNFDQRYRCRKEIVMKGLKYLQKPKAPIEELAKFLYEVQFGSFSNAFFRKVIKIYLGIPHLRGEEIFKITQQIAWGGKQVEAEKLVSIFIKRGDYEALRLIKKEYDKLGNTIVSQSEQIVLSCLKQGRIEDAAGAVSLIPDDDKRQKYCMLLGVDFKANGSDVSDADEKKIN
ncbi:MAG: hypothetical protein Q8N57_01465 [bacterium]|nr:hypothetical protein [bacterium]